MNAVIEPKQELISINSFMIDATPAVVSANFGEMHNLISQIIKDKNALVTPETIQPAKTLCADFRKTSKALMAAWREKRTLSIADVLKADDEVKAICGLLEDGATNISEQVKKIEQEAKDLCLNLLAQERLLTWNQLGVTAEFCKATIDDLIKLGSLTPKGELTKAVKTEVENRCKQDKAQQDKIASRLMELENRCLKAEIIPPLSPASIASFLHADDVVFYGNLDKVVNAEIDRKVEAENRLKAKLEAERRAQELKELEQQQKPVVQNNPIIPEAKQPVAEKSEEPIYPGPGLVHPEQQVRYTVNVTYKHTEAFQFMTKVGTSVAKIENYFRNKVISQGVDEGDIFSVEAVIHE